MEKTRGCPCGRSPTRVCIGWHALSEEKYLEMKKKYEEISEADKKRNPFNHRAIDGLGE